MRLHESLNEALAQAARTWQDRTFYRIGGQDVSFGEFEDQVGRLAAGLGALGLRASDRVAAMMDNSLACANSWFAVNRVGATWVPINTQFRGPGLAHVLRLVQPGVLICDEAYRDLVQGALDETGLKVPLIINGEDPAATSSPILTDLYLDVPAPSVDARPGDLSAMLFTSGTTGRSKACMLSHRYFLSQATIAVREFGLRSDDVLYCPFPLFHADATALTTVPALLLGATAAIGKRFSASRFWDEVRETGSTVFDFMGATLSILNKAEPRDDDTDNPVRLAWGVPVPDWVEDFERRFDLQVIELYGSTEANIPIVQRFDQQRVKGSCGRVVDGFEVRIVDDEDVPVPSGETGELVIRSHDPFTMFSGYYDMPAATVDVTQNLWFHSGDLARMDDEGNVYFVRRKTDAIRRRGENISAFEVEEGVLLHPDVVECAAIGVPSELTEEDVKIVVVVRPGSSLTPEELWAHCQEHLAKFQVPRFIEMTEHIPKTPTGKVEKYRLRDGAPTTATSDAEQAYVQAGAAADLSESGERRQRGTLGNV